jgi:hypothetical protein
MRLKIIVPADGLKSISKNSKLTLDYQIMQTEPRNVEFSLIIK